MHTHKLLKWKKMVSFSVTHQKQNCNKRTLERFDLFRSESQKDKDNSLRMQGRDIYTQVKLRKKILPVCAIKRRKHFLNRWQNICFCKFGFSIVGYILHLNRSNRKHSLHGILAAVRSQGASGENDVDHRQCQFRCGRIQGWLSPLRIERRLAFPWCPHSSRCRELHRSSHLHQQDWPGKISRFLADFGHLLLLDERHTHTHTHTKPKVGTTFLLTVRFILKKSHRG